MSKKWEISISFIKFGIKKKFRMKNFPSPPFSYLPLKLKLTNKINPSLQKIHSEIYTMESSKERNTWHASPCSFFFFLMSQIHVNSPKVQRRWTVSVATAHSSWLGALRSWLKHFIIFFSRLILYMLSVFLFKSLYT